LAHCKAKKPRNTQTFCSPVNPASWVRLGDLLREQGRTAEAREAFIGDYIAAQAMTNWAYRIVRPAAPEQIDLGDGLDFGARRGRVG
jgi:hypothetical protein